MIDDDTADAMSDTAAGSVSEGNTQQQEALQHLSYDGTQITFGALSTGCTVAENFSVQHTVTDGQCEATLVREQPDMCRRAPFVAELSLAWTAPEGCPADSVTFTNPVVDLGAGLKSPGLIRTPRDGN